MLLKTARIRNFRCLSGIDLELDPTTILIGENNSGKTSFLDALRICLSRSIMRRGAGLEDYDYHLSSPSQHPQEAGEMSITLDFILNEDTPEDVIQAIGDVTVFDSTSQRHIILQVSSSFDKSVRDFGSDWNFLDCP